MGHRTFSISILGEGTAYQIIPGQGEAYTGPVSPMDYKFDLNYPIITTNAGTGLWINSFDSVAGRTGYAPGIHDRPITDEKRILIILRFKQKKN